MGPQALIGKGSMSQKTAEAMRKHRWVHLAKIRIYAQGRSFSRDMKRETKEKLRSACRNFSIPESLEFSSD
jgi:ornithine cyclodeaminase/alanine dehydrogenase-like protein (mu-crystallin family)